MMDDPDSPVLTELQAAILRPGIVLSKRDQRACAACHLSAKEGEDLVCRAAPPSVFMFLVPQVTFGPNGKPVQGVMPRSFTQFPVVQPHQWCGKWEQRR
jgi:hypothetical protein